MRAIAQRMVELGYQPTLIKTALQARFPRLTFVVEGSRVLAWCDRVQDMILVADTRRIT